MAASEIIPVTWARPFPRGSRVPFFCLIHDDEEALPGSIPIAPADRHVYALRPYRDSWAVAVLSRSGSLPRSTIVATFPELVEAFEYAEAEAAKRGLAFIAPRLQRMIATAR